MLWEHRDEYVCQIPVKIWNLLIERFGGGPMVRTLESCATCESTLQALNERRQHEKDAYLRLPRLQGAPKYVISAKWLDSWINFVEGHQINPPGPIANSDVLELVPSLDPKCPPVYQWRRGSAYELIPIGWWNLLFEIYGGGPVCVVPNAPSSPSTEALEDENESDEEVDDNDKEEEEKSEDQEEDVGPQADSFGQSSGTHLATSTALLKEDEKEEDDGGAWHRPHMGEEDVIMPGANQSSTEHPELMEVDTASFLYNDEEDTDDAQSPDFLSSKDELTSDATVTSPLLSSSFGYPLTHSGAPPSYRLPSQGSSVSLPAPDLNPVPTPVTHTATTVHEMGLRSLTPTLLERSRLPLGDHKFSLTNNTDAHAEAKVILPPNASGDCDDLHRSKRLDSVVVLSQPFCVQERTFTPQPANGYSAIARSSNSRLSESI
nr:unnamed protein product [Spirometra erinaceieuropaei]